MAVLRRFSFLGQARWDVPHARMLESGVAADFDTLAGQIMAGTKPLVVKGFEIVNSDAAIGKNPEDLQLTASQGLLMHYYATESGTIFYSTSGLITLNSTDSRFEGSFTPNSINYVGIDLFRSTNVGQTEDTVKFLDPVSKQEISRQVPLGEILDFKVVVTTQDFDSIPSLCPVCKITTDDSNNVESIEDCRYTPFRLASGGSFPDVQNSYTWPQGRDENTTGNVFYGGDKALWSYKDWSDAIMTRLWELGGGKYWYSPTADRNVRLTRTGTQFSNGEWFEWDGTNLHWRGLRMVFDNSGTTIWYNTIADQLITAAGAYGTTATNLADGDCLYVDIDRLGNTNISAIKGITAQLGWPINPGSRFILAWRVGSQVFTRDSAFQVGATFSAATTTSMGIVKLSHAATTPAAPIVFSDGSPNVANGVVGLNANVQAAYTSTSNSAPALAVTAFTTATGVQGTGGATSGIGIRGVGGAPNGIGVAGQGTGTGAAGALTTSATGSGLTIAQGTSASNTAPLITIADSAGNIRNVFDHVGYMTGRYNRLFENWQIITTLGAGNIAVPIAVYPTWSAASASGGAIAYVAPTATYPASMFQLSNSGANNSDSHIFTTSQILHTGFTGLLFVVEWEAALSQSTLVAKEMFMGLSNSPSNLNNVIGFNVPSSATYTPWRTLTRSGGTGTAVAGTTGFAANDIVRFRIEFFGSATALGAATARFYVNSVLQNTHTTNIPSQPMHLLFLMIDGGSGGALTMRIGPIVAYWNRYLTSATI